MGGRAMQATIMTWFVRGASKIMLAFLKQLVGAGFFVALQALIHDGFTWRDETTGELLPGEVVKTRIKARMAELVATGKVALKFTEGFAVNWIIEETVGPLLLEKYNAAISSLEKRAEG